MWGPNKLKKKGNKQDLYINIWMDVSMYPNIEQPQEEVTLSKYELQSRRTLISLLLRSMGIDNTKVQKVIIRGPNKELEEWQYARYIEYNMYVCTFLCWSDLVPPLFQGFELGDILVKLE